MRRRYFVIANGMASLHNLIMIIVEIWGDKFDYKGLRLVMIAILDMVCMIMFGQSYYQLYPSSYVPYTFVSFHAHIEFMCI